MPEHQKNELVVWEEDAERVHAEEIPNTEGFYYEKEKSKSNLGLYIFIGAVVTAGVIKILSDRNDLKKRAEERKKNPTEGL